MIARPLMTPLPSDSIEPAKLPKLLETPPSLPRRQFLAAAAAVPAVAVCALLSRPQEVPAVTPVAPVEPASGDDVGYHETEHVRRYYRSAAGF